MSENGKVIKQDNIVQRILSVSSLFFVQNYTNLKLILYMKNISRKFSHIVY